MASPRLVALASIVLVSMIPALAQAQTPNPPQPQTPAQPAEEQPRDPRLVQPERPTLSTHAGTVAPGFIEIEFGQEFDRYENRARGGNFSQEFKIGISPKAQLNVSTSVQSAPGLKSIHFGDVSVGIKGRILEKSKWLGDFAVQPFVKLKTGSVTDGTGTGTNDIGAVAISSRTLGPIALDLNLGYTRRSGDGTTIPKDAFYWAGSFEGRVAGNLGWVAEVSGYPKFRGFAGQESTAAVLIGPTFLVRKEFSIDAGFIAKITGPQPKGFYLGGVWNGGRLKSN